VGVATKETSANVLRTISPVDGSVYIERPLQSWLEVDAALNKAKRAQKSWSQTPLAERQRIVLRFLDVMIANAQAIGEELTWQMGRPIAQTPGEILRGFQERVRYIVDLAPKALADVIPDDSHAGIKRYVRREPLGIVAVIAPWNYPYLTSVNTVVPALLSGSAVMLKHSHQTPLVADRYAAAFEAAGLPEGVFQRLDLSHEDTETLIADPRVDYVNFTGSVRGGHAVQKAISGKFIDAGLELGGKDPAYVRPDADMKQTVENLVDGSFFNSGQSCCGIERIYVHEKIYKTFVDDFVDLTYQYRFGNPTDPAVNLGPMVRTAAAEFVRQQIAEAVHKGGKALIDARRFPASQPGTPYLAPQVLIDVDHSMSIMMEETFGPAVGIMKVNSDEEALQLMNDSPFGLSASLWTGDADAAEAIGQEIDTGTVFLNRCDYLDPGLAWTGVKDTGRGASLSIVGFEHLTRPKSFHLRRKI
jgi:acyl-CoA reductase-like NAD-dependent aldehyde dehydrogenase